jgi:predicted DNA-binding protein with PD1-like motif
MIFSKLGSSRYVLRLEKGDDIVPTLRTFAAEHGIRAGFFEGIGSLNKAKLGHYDFQTKTYKHETFEDDLEIITLSGNIAVMGKQIIPHAHATLGRRDFSVIGGHLDEDSLANMVEIGIEKLPGKLVKAKDEEVGLNLLQLSRRH